MAGVARRGQGRSGKALARPGEAPARRGKPGMATSDGAALAAWAKSLARGGGKARGPGKPTGSARQWPKPANRNRNSSEENAHPGFNCHILLIAYQPTGARRLDPRDPDYDDPARGSRFAMRR